MLPYESDDIDDEFRAAWESSFSAEKRSHIAQRKEDKVTLRIDQVKEQLALHRKEAEECLKLSALHSEGQSSIQKRLRLVASELQEESAAVEELSTLLRLAEAKKQQSNDKVTAFMEFRSQSIE